VDFVINAFSDKVIGWLVSTETRANFILMVWTRQFVVAAQPSVRGWSTITIGARNSRQFVTPSGWPQGY
jgi:hypothetical protein